MLEQLVVDYLNSRMSVPVYLKRPSNPPSEYVVIEKVGGSRDTYIRTSTLAIQTYADTLYDTCILKEEVIEYMDEIDLLDEITQSSYNSDYNYTDLETKKERYQVIYDITHY